MTKPVSTSIADELRALEREGLRRSLRVVAPAPDGRWTLGGRDVLVACSNDYLGLARDPQLAEAAAATARAEGAGPGAARLICGTRPAQAALEAAVAEWLGTEAALTFSSGYAGNVSALGALFGPEDVVVSDALNHASLIDGIRLSGAERRVVAHCDVGAVRAALADRDRFRRAGIVTDGLFSMDGDVAPLADLLAVAREANALLYVDDAHGAGVLGPTGRGALEAAGIGAEPDVVRFGTFGKAFGSTGAFVAGTRDVCDLVMHRGRGFLFSTAPSPPTAAAAAAGLSIADAEPQRRARCLSLAKRLRDGLRARGLDVADAPGPIVSIVLGAPERAVAASARLLDAHAVLVTAIRPPTVPEGTARLRLTTSAGHTEEEIDRVVAAVAEVVA